MCSSRSLALLLLAGCNQLFGIKDTKAEPPAFYDGGIDAARGCPAFGAPPDGYSPFVHELYVQDCYHFSSVPAGRAVAICYDPKPAVHEGVSGQPLPAAPGIAFPLGTSFGPPRLSPDGQRMLVPISVLATQQNSIGMFLRQPDGSWLQGPDPGFGPLASPARISTIGHAPTGDRVLVTMTDTREWEYDGTAWHELMLQIPSMFGTQPADMSLTVDGLHLLVTDQRDVTYADRADIGSVFRAAVPVSGVPALDALFMTDDCARVYMSGFGALYYVQQD